ncbi:P-loop containing nucleoside triphosphatehydrolases superfamily protein, partial [Striga asiatica]
MREYVSATPPHYQSPLSSPLPSLSEFPVLNDYLRRQSVGERARRAPIALDLLLHLRRHDLAPESRSSSKDRADSSKHLRRTLENCRENRSRRSSPSARRGENQQSTDEETKISNLRLQKLIQIN